MVTLLAAFAAASDCVLGSPAAPATYGQVLVAADVDRDGVDDLLVGDPTDRGTVSLWAGVPGACPTLRWEVSGAATAERLGEALAVGPDVDGDGIPELAATAPGLGTSPVGEEGEKGGVVLLSGVDGTTLASATATAEEGWRLGVSVTFVGDMDRDGRSELLVGAPAARYVDQPAGNVASWTVDGAALVDGTAGSLSMVADGFGVALLPIDLDGDGVEEVLAGADAAGLVYRIVDLATPPEGWAPALTTDALGQTLVALGDTDGDGEAEVGIGAEAALYGLPAVAAPVGPPWALAFTETEPHFAAPGDLNGDGRADLVVEERGALVTAGRLAVHLGGVGGPGAAPAWELVGDPSEGWIGTVVAVGDWNGDGEPDLATRHVGVDEASSVWIWWGEWSGLPRDTGDSGGDESEESGVDTAKSVGGAGDGADAAGSPVGSGCGGDRGGVAVLLLPAAVCRRRRRA